MNALKFNDAMKFLDVPDTGYDKSPKAIKSAYVISKKLLVSEFIRSDR